MRRSSLWLVLCLLCVAMAHADTPTPDAAAVFRTAQRIVTTDGLDQQQKLRIGGIDQWVTVRGRHRDAPILLFLHGGPGFTSLPTRYYYQVQWEEYFNVVQWDQRGAGKTYALNDAERIRPGMTIERMVDDAEELVSYLRKTYGRQKIVLVGHSWGTVLGVKLAQRHPDWFYAYVGMGQVVDMPRSEAMGYAATLQAARDDGNQQAVAELESIAPFPDPASPKRTLANLEKERHWLTYYNGYTWHAQEGHDGDVAQLSPDYSAADLKARLQGMDFSLGALWEPLSKVSFAHSTHFDCPVVLMQGRHDLNTSASLLGEWFKTLDAPSKQLVWFDDSAHMLFEEESGKVFVHLVEDVLPLTHPPQETRAHKP
ncbi:alpha/beta fold hydrolase [Dyella silvatica]|uniref:alpha/beta fold hydrolase n=1 Tax=Dyella silvatica TaxID=2992128 RepID=UPI0022543F90|nr:alpha/beta hydrolase [Dyella silvatica]